LFDVTCRAAVAETEVDVLKTAAAAAAAAVEDQPGVLKTVPPRLRLTRKFLQTRRTR